ncbi:MAG: low molecular weight phosphotyrosine protein phosphatase [Pseudomonadota bacterium]|nr:MAG: low molecular weight phosphotyrosine protein phosphatase [Pseudomonadota bacterium]
MQKIEVLFICMGNICRSPTAQGVFRHLVVQEGMSDVVVTDSAGTHAYHVGNPPDGQALATAQQRGIDISDMRARRVGEEDFERFHYVLAMDRDNYAILEDMCPEQHRHKLRFFMEFAPERRETEVPDPYYGGRLGFEKVFDLVEEASRGLLEDIRTQFLPGGGEMRSA